MGNVLSKHGKVLRWSEQNIIHEYEQIIIEGLWPSQYYIDQLRFRERIINCELVLQSTLLEKLSLCKMAPLEQLKYLTIDQVRSKLMDCQTRKPFWCSGFLVPDPNELKNNVPVKGVHYDGDARMPITVLCTHQEIDGKPCCQEYSSIAYLLVYAYLHGDWTPDQWRTLFPNRDGWRLGFPEIAPIDPRYPNCEGYKFVSGDPKQPNHSPGKLKYGLDIDPTTKCMYTKKCIHDACDPAAAYMFALFRAYALNMMMSMG